jgi:hypothetical protein
MYSIWAGTTIAPLRVVISGVQQTFVSSGQKLLRSVVESSETIEVLRAAAHANHEPAPEEGEAVERYNRLKRRAVEQPEAPPAQILRHELREVCNHDDADPF